MPPSLSDRSINLYAWVVQFYTSSYNNLLQDHLHQCLVFHSCDSLPPAPHQRPPSCPPTGREGPTANSKLQPYFFHNTMDHIIGSLKNLIMHQIIARVKVFCRWLIVCVKKERLCILPQSDRSSRSCKLSSFLWLRSSQRPPVKHASIRSQIIANKHYIQPLIQEN